MQQDKKLGQDWIQRLGLAKAISSRVEQRPQKGCVAELPQGLHPAVRTAAVAQGYNQMYRHQIEAVEAALAGEDVVITTPTASGKSLAFQLPILQAAIESGESQRSLYLAPTKALINDQQSKFHLWTRLLADEGVDLRVATLTGDTPGDRALVFRPVPQVLLSTPDCINVLLYKARYPQFVGLKRFLRQLKYVVLDEAHSYTGPFGANMAGLMRRLRLAVVRAGGEWDQVRFILATATVGNPRKLWSQLCGRELDHPMRLVERSSAAFPGRTLLYTNGKVSSQARVAQLLSDLIQAEMTTILFVDSRSLGRSMLALMGQQAVRQGLSAQTCAIFHGTLSPQKRQEVTRAIAQGRLRLIIATSALEQGVDFPQIDVAVCWGFPGVNRLRQRFGRAGRGDKSGLGIFIPRLGSSSDGYYARRSQELAEAAPEPVMLRISYAARLRQHILAAAGESGISLRQELQQVFGEAGVRAAQELLNEGKLFLYQGTLTAPHSSALGIAMRGQQFQQIKLLECESREEIEVMSRTLAHRELYPGAIYSTLDDQGEINCWQVRELNLKTGEAIAEAISPESPYTTHSNQELSVEMDEEQPTQERIVTIQSQGHWEPIELALTLGWGKVEEAVVGYETWLTCSELACRNSDCKNHKVGVSSRYRECRSCGGPLILWSISREMVKQELFEQPLKTAYETPILRLEWVGEGARAALEDLATGIRKRLLQEYDEVPSWHSDILDMPPELVGLHSLSHLLMNALPVRGQPVEASDLIQPTPGKSGQVLLFDDADRGTGTVEYLYEHLEDLLAPAYHLAAECNCEARCPQCCSSSHCTDENVAIYRPLVEQLLGSSRRN